MSALSDRAVALCALPACLLGNAVALSATGVLAGAVAPGDERAFYLGALGAATAAWGVSGRLLARRRAWFVWLAAAAGTALGVSAGWAIGSHHVTRPRRPMLELGTYDDPGIWAVAASLGLFFGLIVPKLRPEP